ncbi:hypothetical protein AtDm6_1249 [Acetobacter tropicalis]|uniref:Uncharacterized protein n=1 Tax=Acetobacter tropicalis TaxID=104102 RepID=A0A094YSE7_9PROT|nr:hypothetical protein AtDm6_1249 [Acetobacter tropicalis]
MAERAYTMPGTCWAVLTLAGPSLLALAGIKSPEDPHCPAYYGPLVFLVSGLAGYCCPI